MRRSLSRKAFYAHVLQSSFIRLLMLTNENSLSSALVINVAITLTFLYLFLPKQHFAEISIKGSRPPTPESAVVNSGIKLFYDVSWLMKQIFLISEVSLPNMNRIAEELKHVMNERNGSKGQAEENEKKQRAACEKYLFSFSRPSSPHDKQILLPLNGRRGEKRMQKP